MGQTDRQTDSWTLNSFIDPAQHTMYVCEWCKQLGVNADRGNAVGVGKQRLGFVINADMVENAQHY